MPTRLPPRLPQEEAVTKLKNELDDARWTVIRLLPNDIQRIAMSYHRCETSSDLWAWRRGVIEQVIELAELLPQAPFADSRAYCPLCGQGSSSTHGREYSIPKGLEMHPDGSESAHQCSVTRIIWAIAHDSKKEAVRDGDRRKREEEDATIKARRSTETLWRVDQDEPKLVNEGFLLSLGLREVRDEESMAFAEERLGRLGSRKQLTETSSPTPKRLWTSLSMPTHVSEVTSSLSSTRKRSSRSGESVLITSASTFRTDGKMTS